MRPITLRIEGFRSFGTERPTTIEFGDRDLIAIVGDTGAGKSSILEAMTYSLYGRTSFAGNAHQEVVNDQSAYCEVALRFWAESYEWEVHRRLDRKRSGEVGKSSAVLTKHGDDDEPIETTEGIHQVNRRAAEVLGLDAPAFLRTMVLPQGRFARLLAEDEPRNRSQILRQIWRTEDIDAAAAALKPAMERAGTLRERLEADLDHLPEDPAEQLKAAESAAAGAHKHNKSAQHGAEAAREQVDRRAALEAEQTSLETLEAELSRARPDMAAATEIADAAAALSARAKTAAELEARALTELKTAPPPAAEEEKRLDRRREAVDTALSCATTVESDETRAQEAKSEHEAAERQASESARNAGETTRGASTAQRESDGAAAKAAAAEEAAKSAETAVTDHQTRYEIAATQQREQLKAQNEEKAQAHHAREAAATAHETQRTTAEEAEERAEQAAAENLAAATAHGHQPGDACPICEQELPADWQPPVAPDLQAHNRAAKDADAAARRTRRTLERAEARAEQAVEQARTLEEDAAALESAGIEAGVELNEALGLDPWSTAGDRERAVISLRTLAAASTAKAQDLATAAHEQSRQAASGQAEATAAAEAAARERRRRDEAARAATRSGKRLAEALTALTNTLEPDGRVEDADLLRLDNREPDKTREGLEKLRDKTAEEIGRVRDRSKDHRLKTQAALDARTAVDRVRQEQERLVARPLQELLEQAQRAREIAVGGIAAHGLTTRLPPVASQVGAEGAKAEIGRVIAGLDMTKVDVRKHQRTREHEMRATETALGKALETAGIHPTGTTAGDVAAVREHAEVTAAADYQTREEVARLRSIRKPVEQLLRLHGQVTEHEGRLKEVADGLRASRFPKWLTLRRSTDLLRHGSRQLEKMSGGRYAFADPRETAEEWKVIDRWSGAARTPATLSGGEQFMAALALSLGMVETMGERGGRLECMFLDEGFGTLDRQSLDEAVEALYAGSRPDHMIGVITHVREVAERMPAVLRVEREPGRGSQAEWLAESERHQLLGQDERQSPAE